MKPPPPLHIQSFIWLRRLADALIEPIDTSTRFIAPAAPIPQAPCPRCAHSAPKVTVTPQGCPQCFNTRLPWASATRLYDYTGPIVGAIHAMKYHARWPLAQKLGGRLALRIARRNLTDGQTLVTPVPMHWARRLSRGYNHAHVIAQAVAAGLDIPCIPLLKRTRNNPAQVGLSRANRLENLKNAIAPLEIDLTGRSILLIDDVTTTGATLQACAKALKQAGAAQVHTAVIAVASPVK